MQLREEPFKKFSTNSLPTMEFLVFFPDGEKNPLNKAVIREVPQNETESVFQKIEKLITLVEIDNKK